LVNSGPVHVFGDFIAKLKSHDNNGSDKISISDS